MVGVMPKVKRVRFEDHRLLQAYRITSMRSENPINQALTPGEIPVSQSLGMTSSRDHFTATLLRPPYYGHPITATLTSASTWLTGVRRSGANLAALT